MSWIADNATSLIGSAVSLGSSIINAKSANEQLEKQFQQQKELYAQQFADQKQMIAEQNEYNSYANQRKLMEEAGLNPQLMYGDGTSGALQSEVANPQVPQAPLKQGAGSMIAGGIDKGIATMMSLQQLRLLEAQANKAQADADYTNILNKYTPAQYEQQLRKGEVDIQYTTALIDKNLTDIAEGKSRIEVNNEQAKLLTAQFDESKLRALAQLYNIEYTQANTQYIKEKAATEILEQGLFAYREALMTAQTNEANAQTASIRSKTFEQDWKNSFIANTGFSPDAGQWQMITQWCGNMSTQIGSGLSKVWNKIKSSVPLRAESLTD